MTGRHAGPTAPDQVALLDQVRAVQHDISRYLVDAAAAPLQTDTHTALVGALERLARVYPILNRAGAVLLQVEIEAEHG